MNNPNGDPFSFVMTFALTDESSTRFTRSFEETTAQLEARVQAFYASNPVPDTTELVLIGSDSDTVSFGSLLRLPQLKLFVSQGFTAVENTILSAGNLHSLAIDELSNVWAWGINNNGQLGDGTTTDRTVPVQLLTLSNIRSVSAGDRHSLALDELGNVWAWGRNEYGQLGDGSTTNRHLPVQVLTLSNIHSISAAGSHSLALDELGNVWA